MERFYNLISRRYVQLLLFILIIILLVLGAGAPGAGGDIGI